MSQIVAVLIPVYRNDDTLEELTQRAIKSFEDAKTDFRLVFIIDASPDKSWEIIYKLAQHDPRIVGIHLTNNVGQHKALLIGLKNVAADWYIVMDADLQDPPEFLTSLLQKAQKMNSTIFASRQGKYQQLDRMITSRIHKKLLSWLTGLPSTVGTYLVFNTEVAEKICKRVWRKPHLVVLAKQFSSTWDVCDYQRMIRPQGTSAYSFLGRLRAAYETYICVLESKMRNGKEAPVALNDLIGGSINL